MGKRGNAVGEDGMAGLEVKSVNLLGTPVSYAYAVKAGPWIFLTGHEAFDFAGGTPEAVAGPAGFPLFGRPRSRRECDFILQRMRRILQEFGADLSNGVRLDQVYPNPAAVAAYHLARHAEFGDYIPPSTSVIMERCFSADTTISSSLIAVVPGAEYEIRKIHPEGVASAPTSGFVPTVVCNEFVFVAGQMAHNPGQGLDPRAHVPDHSAWAGAEIRKQTEFLILEKLRPALEAAGSSLERSLKAQIYLANIEDALDCLDAWNQYYADIPCAVTKDDLAGLCGAGACRPHPGGGDLRLCRGFVPSRRYDDGQAVTRAIFRRRRRCVSRDCDGLVDAVRTPAAPLRLCADADANASARNSRHRRFLDLHPTIARLVTHPSGFSR